MIEMLAQIEHRGLSLDAPKSPDGTSMIDELESGDNQADELESRESQRMLPSALGSARQALDPREAFILDHRLMADPEERLSLSELGAHFGVSRERVRQLEVRTRSKLEQRTVAEISPAAPGAAAA